jgi:hypothetical protein
MATPSQMALTAATPGSRVAAVAEVVAVFVWLRVMLNSGGVSRRQHEAADHRNKDASSGVDDLAVLDTEGGLAAVEEVAPDSVKSREGMTPIRGQIPIDMAQVTVRRPD